MSLQKENQFHIDTKKIKLLIIYLFIYIKMQSNYQCISIQINLKNSISFQIVLPGNTMKKSNSQMDEFKTPSPSRRKIPQRSLFTDRCSRSMASQTQNRFQNDMDMLPSTPKFSSPIRSNKKSLCRTDPIPRKFRCEMPQSARKVEPQPLPPSEREFRPIIQSSFYGKKAKLSDGSSAGLISPTSHSTTKPEASDVVERPVLKSLQVSVNTGKTQGCTIMKDNPCGHLNLTPESGTIYKLSNLLHYFQKTNLMERRRNTNCCNEIMQVEA